jgi:cell division protein FtsI (penicillin-binding protein 3)
MAHVEQCGHALARAKQESASMSARRFNTSSPNPDQTSRRVLVVASIIVLWMFVIAGRLVYLQMFQHSWLRERADAQQQDTVNTIPQRGLVYDRQGRELARSIETETLYVEPQKIDDIRQTARSVAPIIGQDSAKLEAKLQTAKASNKKSILLDRKLDEDHANQIRDLKQKSLYLVKEPKRFYPNGSLAAHILGFVGLDNAGLAGVEQQFNQRIKGEGGKLFVETDGGKKRASYSSFETPSKPGESIVLTIDQLIQFRTEQALQAAMDRTHAKSASAIVLDPHTGEVLALANVPTFDPNSVRAVAPGTLANQALQNIYEPGSTFKAVAYSAAIEKKLVKPDDMIDCQMGSITVAGRLVHDHKPFGTLTITEALEKSSNVAAIKLGIRVGDESMADYITRFGFGKRTGIELPGETAGLVRPLSRWLPSSIGSIAMGQEIGVTPLQMAAAYGAIANDGIRIAPHLIREIKGADGTTVYRSSPEQHRVISADTAKQLRTMLEAVTLNGTAKRAQLEGYSAAGKTGTAQKIDPATKAYSRSKFVGSFVGFAPVDNPSVVIIVVVDEPKGSYHGGDVAAPVFREIAEQILPEMEVAPDTELKPTPGSGYVARNINPEAAAREREQREVQIEEQRATLPQASTDSARPEGGEIIMAVATRNGVVMPDLQGSSVRDAMRVCAQLGLQLEARGDGRAVRQNPSPGSELIRGQTVRIDFGRSD